MRNYIKVFAADCKSNSLKNVLDLKVGTVNEQGCLTDGEPTYEPPVLLSLDTIRDIESSEIFPEVDDVTILEGNLWEKEKLPADRYVLGTMDSYGNGFILCNEIMDALASKFPENKVWFWVTEQDLLIMPYPPTKFDLRHYMDVAKFPLKLLSNSVYEYTVGGEPQIYTGREIGFLMK